MSADPEPRLAPPGAGLPAVERQVARLWLAMRRRLGTRRAWDARFAHEQRAILGQVNGCSAETGARRVLIGRAPGLEDSSRFWSVWMTLEHLHIVNSALADVIGSLTQGLVPDVVISTAAVKPRPDVGQEAISAFEASCARLSAVVADVPDLSTRARLAHPWFGPLDAASWYVLAGVHLGVHKVQIRRILTGIASR